MRQWLVWSVVLLAGCGSSPPGNDPVHGVGSAVEPLLGAPHPDPLAAGPLNWTTQDYDLGSVVVGGPEAAHGQYEYEALIRGVITVPDGPGPFPLAVFLHGQHQTCSGPDGREGSDCSRPYRNDMGYLYLMEHLASHGVATASILAHEINQQNGAGDVGMWARGELVLATIDALSASPYATHLDLSRIGLMGHSRGGEGVVTAVEVNGLRTAPHELGAVIALAPTDFAYRSVPDVPFLTLAPYCDGDVYSLHGLRQFDQSRYTDDAAVKVQLLVMGANHNNYNTNWGRPYNGLGGSHGDDAGPGRHQNTHCDLEKEEGGGRLSLDETYAQAILHMGGFLRWTLLGEAAMAPYFLGADQHPDACPDLRPCPGAVHVSTMAPGRRDLFWAEQGGAVAAPGLTVSEHPVCRMQSCAENVYSSAWMADILIVEPTTFHIGFDAPTDLRTTSVLNVRIGVPTDKSVNLEPPEMSVVFTDTSGSHRVQVAHPALFLPPGLVVDPGIGGLGLAYVGGAKVAANAVSIRLPAGLDGSNVTAIDLEFSGTGPDRVLVADAWLNGSTASPVHLPAEDSDADG